MTSAYLAQALSSSTLNDSAVKQIEALVEFDSA